ncbi:MAG: riboflavin biosynthesis protein RibF [Phycisphaerae bacterium]|jgi:riboflavin kinase/FMN adenylyltransferase
MLRRRGFEEYSSPARGAVVLIGNFDGVHLGHRRLVDAAARRASALGAQLVAITFEPHPLAIVAPHRAPARLTTCDEKLDLLEACGVEATIVLRADAALIGTPAEDFLAELVQRCRPRVIVEGPTFNFGRGRAGSVETLRALAGRHGFEVEVVPELHCEELADRPAVSSSAIRAALAEGLVERAAAMLGRPYRIAGVVGHGEHRGVELGFPTANVDRIPHLLPAHAVYAAVAQLADGALRLAAVNIGPQPTFGQAGSRVEAHLLDWHRSLRGARLGLHLLGRLREQVRFESVERLVAQLRKDVAAVCAMAPALERLRGLSLPRV